MKSNSVEIQIQPLKQYFCKEEEEGKKFVCDKRDLTIIVLV